MDIQDLYNLVLQIYEKIHVHIILHNNISEPIQIFKHMGKPYPFADFKKIFINVSLYEEFFFDGKIIEKAKYILIILLWKRGIIMMPDWFYM